MEKGINMVPGDLKPIFWSQIDDCIVDCPLNNFPLQKISRAYPVYFVYSGVKCHDILKKVYTNAFFIPCLTNNDNEKAKNLFALLKKKQDYDVLVRTCCDSVIVNVQWLLNILRDNLSDKHAIIGNVRPDWVRGGCNVISRSVVNCINMPDDSSLSYDATFTLAVKKTGASIISHDLFGIGPENLLKYPVCHPHRYPNEEINIKIDRFLEIIKLSEKKNGK